MWGFQLSTIRFPKISCAHWNACACTTRNATFLDEHLLLCPVCHIEAVNMSQ